MESSTALRKPDPPLAELEVLLVDLQATGANPASGHPIEAAWFRYRASAPVPTDAEVFSSLVRLPEEVRLPPQVARITGLADAQLARAPGATEVFRRLFAAAGNRPLVAHYARYEEGFLARQPNRAPAVLCTHDIARRLLADLPRRGLRAVAGVLGHPTPELRRAAPHVVATAAVWKGLVGLLSGNLGIETLPALGEWLERTPVPPRGRRVYAMPRDLRLDLPDRPGVYRFRGVAGEILYVGKATSLRSRVNSYFRKQKHEADRTLEMLTRARSIEATPTATPLEAALLETDEIKRLAPPYNVALRGGAAVGPWWVDRAFTRAARRPGKRHPHGPFGRAEGALALGALSELMGGRGKPERRAELWARVAPYRLAEPGGVALLEEAALELAARHAPFDGVSGALARLLGMARRFERAARAAEPAAASTPEPEVDPAPEGAAMEEATAASVADGLERQFAHLSREIRRGRWIVRLSSSRVRYPAAEGARRELDVRAGRLAKARDVVPAERLRRPPPAPRPAALDSVGWDRLRVLLAELRRLAAEGAELELELSGKRRFSGDRLRRMLLGI